MAREKPTRILNRKTVIRLEREARQKKLLIIGVWVVFAIVVAVISAGLVDKLILEPNKPVAEVGDIQIKANDFQTRVRYERWSQIQSYFNTLQTAEMFGGDETFQSYFETQLKAIEDNLNSPIVVGGEALERMIEEALIAREAEKLGIEVSDEEVEQELQSEFGYYEFGTPTPTITPTMVSTSTLSPLQLTLVTTSTPSATPEVEATGEGTGDSGPAEESPTDVPEEPSVEEPAVEEPVVEESPTTEVEAEPSPTITPYTYEAYQEQVDVFLDAVKDTKFSEKDLRKMVYNQILRDKVFKALTTDAPTSTDQVWARHILLNDEETALEVLAKLEAGEDWAALAAEYSQDPSNKDISGDLGWFGLGAMLPDFEKAAFNLSVGQTTTEPVQTDYGFHIIQVLGHEMRPLTASEIQSAKNDIFNGWLDTAKGAEDVVRYNDFWINIVPETPTLYEFFQQAPEE